MITMEPVAHVRTSRSAVEDDFWGGIESEIVLDESFGADALDGIEEYSHLEILFVFDRLDESKIIRGARRPRNNPGWPKCGVFAQRTKNRPNRIGATIVKLLGRAGRVLRVTGLDAIDGTPVIDIKPVFAEFLPGERVRQPQWTHELMREYFAARE